MLSTPLKVRPAKRLMEASGKCTKEGAAYGQCVLNSYQTMQKDTCAKEFAIFKQCVQKTAGRRL